MSQPPYPPQYGHSPAGPYPGQEPTHQVREPKNGLGTAGFTLGLLGLLFSPIPIIGVIAWPLVILGLIFSIIGFNRARRGEATNRGLSIAGIICSALGLLLCIIWVAALGNAANSDTVGGVEIPAAPTQQAAQVPETEAAQPTAVATPEPPPTPIVHEGKGDDVVELTKPVGVAVLDFECSNCSRNVIVKSDGRDGLLVNTVGSYSGRHLIDASETARTSTLEIQAKGSWKVTVTPGLSALRVSGGETISGSGDDVVAIQGSTSKALITNRGERNFIVKATGGWTSNLLVNEVGSYEGTVRLDAPAVVTVQSTGDWSITPS